MLLKNMIRLMALRKYLNAIANGNFANGITGWTSVTVANFTANNNEASFNVTAYNGEIRSNVNAQNGRKYYICANIKATKNTIRLSIAGLGAVYHDGSGQYKRLSNILTWNTTSGNWWLTVRDESSSAWTTINVKDVIAIDLTSLFGSGNEPTLAWCDANIPQNIIW